MLLERSGVTGPGRTLRQQRREPVRRVADQHDAASVIRRCLDFVHRYEDDVRRVLLLRDQHGDVSAKLRGPAGLARIVGALCRLS
jgi:hypothetical protein